MKVGVTYPQIELGGDPKALHKFARAVEDLGYDHILLYDHVVGVEHKDRNPPLWGPYTNEDPFHDPFVAFGYLAGITNRIELVTGILILPQRQTVLAAKQAAEIDLLSDGRLRLGVGTGWNYVEYDALGQSFKDRGAKLSEQIVLMRRLWDEPLVSFSGKFDAIERANIIPRPNRAIPIYCGGFSEPAFRRAAKLADGFIFAMGFEDGALPGWARIQELLKIENRSVEGFGAHYIMQGTGGRTLDRDEIAEILPRWTAAGGTHASIVTMQLGFDHVDQHIEYITKLKDII